jgi:hypothetical protein
MRDLTEIINTLAGTNFDYIPAEIAFHIISYLSVLTRYWIAKALEDEDLSYFFEINEFNIRRQCIFNQCNNFSHNQFRDSLSYLSKNDIRSPAIRFEFSCINPNLNPEIINLICKKTNIESDLFKLIFNCDPKLHPFKYCNSKFYNNTTAQSSSVMHYGNINIILTTFTHEQQRILKITDLNDSYITKRTIVEDNEYREYITYIDETKKYFDNAGELYCQYISHFIKLNIEYDLEIKKNSRHKHFLNMNYTVNKIDINRDSVTYVKTKLIMDESHKIKYLIFSLDYYCNFMNRQDTIFHNNETDVINFISSDLGYYDIIFNMDSEFTKVNCAITSRNHENYLDDNTILTNLNSLFFEANRYIKHQEWQLNQHSYHNTLDRIRNHIHCNIGSNSSSLVTFIETLVSTHSGRHSIFADFKFICDYVTNIFKNSGCRYDIYYFTDYGFSNQNCMKSTYRIISDKLVTHISKRRYRAKNRLARVEKNCSIIHTNNINKKQYQLDKRNNKKQNMISSSKNKR